MGLGIQRTSCSKVRVVGTSMSLITPSKRHSNQKKSYRMPTTVRSSFVSLPSSSSQSNMTADPSRDLIDSFSARLEKARINLSKLFVSSLSDLYSHKIHQTFGFSSASSFLYYRIIIIMGLVLSTLWARFSSNREYRLLMLGLDAAGKTTVLYKLKVSTE